MLSQCHAVVAPRRGRIRYGVGAAEGGGLAGDEERAKLVWNEQVKLAATWCNTVSAGCLVVGIVAPSVSLSLGALSPIGLGRAVAVALPLLATSAGLHWFGRKLLKGLRP